MKTIKQKKRFERVFSRGKRFNGVLVRAIVCRNKENCSGEVAFVAAKRLGNAVRRNRSKRVLRETAYRCELPLEKHDVVLLATHKTAFSHPVCVAHELQKLLKNKYVCKQ